MENKYYEFTLGKTLLRAGKSQGIATIVISLPRFCYVSVFHDNNSFGSKEGNQLINNMLHIYMHKIAKRLQ